MRNRGKDIINLSLLRLIVFYENASENKSCERACDKELSGHCHGEVLAVGHDVIGNEVGSEAVAVVNSDEACKENLSDNGENLNGKDDGNGTVSGLDNSERKEFCDMA